MRKTGSVLDLHVSIKSEQHQISVIVFQRRNIHLNAHTHGLERM